MFEKLENLCMALVGVVVRIFFIFYSAATNLVVFVLLAAWSAYVLSKGGPAAYAPWWYALPVLLALGVVYTLTRPGPPLDNPFRRYPGWFGRIDKCADAFIGWIGRIKYFTSPLSLAEDPGSYMITGSEIRELIDRKLQPGDILLRGYNGYLDGIMIAMTGGGQGLGKYFSHAAFYAGELKNPDDKEIAARRLQMQKDSGEWRDATPAEKDKIRDDPRYYQEGRQMVVHSMSRGVFVEDILTFLRCDYLAVLRLCDEIKLSPDDLKHDRSLIKHLPDDAEAVHARLMKGGSVRREDVIKIARLSALGKIGSCYDFQFSDIKTGNRFSCSEFVYYCFKSIHCYLGLEPVIHSFLKIFFKKSTISPADIYDAAVNTGKLEIVWLSDTLKEQQPAAGPLPAPAAE